MKSIIDFLSGVRIEFSRVVWPKFDEFVGSTIIVLFLVVVFALYLAVLDYGFKKLIFEGITSYIYKIYGGH